jgi:hypothetical protein
MKAIDIKQGHIYIIRHHDGQLTKVRVDYIRPADGSSLFHKRTHYICTKLSTNRQIEVKSAAKFRSEVI